VVWLGLTAVLTLAATVGAPLTAVAVALMVGLVAWLWAVAMDLLRRPDPRVAA